MENSKHYQQSDEETEGLKKKRPKKKKIKVNKIEIKYQGWSSYSHKKKSLKYNLDKSKWSQSPTQYTSDNLNWLTTKYRKTKFLYK